MICVLKGHTCFIFNFLKINTSKNYPLFQRIKSNRFNELVGYMCALLYPIINV